MTMQQTPHYNTTAEAYKPVPYELPAIIESVLTELGYVKGEHNMIFKTWVRGRSVIRFYTFLPDRMDIRLCDMPKKLRVLKPVDRMVFTVEKNIDVNTLASLLTIMSGVKLQGEEATTALAIDNTGNIGFS